MVSRSEVVSLLQAADESMEDLQRSMNDEPDPLGVNEWKRKADTFFTLFGTQIQTSGWTFSGNDDDPNFFPTEVWRKLCIYACLPDARIDASDYRWLL
jgi:hypothetical protein